MNNRYFDLSVPQKSILMAEQYYHDKPINNNCAVMCFPDADIPCLIEAVNDFIEHTQAMRFVLKNKYATPEEAQQYIVPFSSENISVYEWGEKDRAYEARLNAIFSEKLDIEKKLYKTVIFSFPDGSAELVFVLHHLITDAFAAAEALKAISANYAKLRNGEIPDVRMSDYSDFLENQQDYFSDKKYKRNEKFFCEYLKKAFIPASITADNGDVSAQRMEIFLSDQEKESISKLMELSDSTIASVMMSLYGLYFAKTGENDRIAIGCPYLNRISAAEKNTFGLFVNTLPVIFDIGEALRFSEFCRRTGALNVSLMMHQRFPYRDIQKIAERLHGISGKLFDVLFNYVTIGVDGFEETEWMHSGTSQYGLCIHFTELKKGRLKVAYDHLETVSDDYVRRLHATVFQMAKWITEHPETSLHDIPVAFEAETEKYRRLNATKVAYNDALTVTDLFEAHRNALGTAVVCADEKLSWSDLFARTDRIAAALIKRGVSKNAPVAICMKRSADFICAVFGVLKAGAAFLPMDLNWPKDRKEHIIKDSSASIIIDENCFAGLLKESTANGYSAPEIGADDLCYMIYTSGSTGTPKGVMLTHKNAVNFSLPLQYNYLVKEINERCSHVLSIGNLSFDISISEYFPALLNGKTLVLADEEELNSIEKLTECMISNQVDCLQITPSRLLEYLDNAQFTAALKRMKVIMAAAEAFPEALAERIKNVSDAVLLNGYGPTETTMGASYAYVTDGKITIGKPISNVSMYIMNRFGNLLAPMQAGELCIGGNGVGRGYVNLPELSEKSFPVTEKFGRLYRTGDRAMLNENGEIEFLGRIDRQVKLHGLRIETAEIENVMLFYPSVTGAAVRLAGEGKAAYLVCYYSSEHEIDERELKAFLASKLTYYMVPSVFCRMESIPVTANGKIDYRRLPEIRFEDKLLPCETDTQKRILEIISGILGTDQIGLTTDLLRVGMTSLSALRLNSELAKAFGVDVGAIGIMQAPSIQALERLISGITDRETTEVDIPENKTVFPLGGGQTGIWIDCASAADAFNYHLPVRLSFSAQVDPVRLCGAVREAFLAHPYLLSKLGTIDAEPMIFRQLAPEFEVSLCRREEPENIAFVRPFDLTGGELCRAAVYYNESKVCLYIDIHHILCDGETLRLLIKDIESIYTGGSAGKESCNGFEYAVREEKRGNSSAYSGSVEFYDALFMGAEQVSSIRPEINGVAHEAKSILGTLSEADGRALADFSQSYGVTVGNIMLAAAELVLSRYTRSDDVIIAAAENGRSYASYETTFGMLVKTLLLRQHVDADETVRDFVLAAADNLYKNIENSAVPYPVLTERYGLIPEIMFTYQNVGVGDLGIIENDAEVSYVDPETAHPKFPISFDISGRDLRLEYDAGRYEEAVMRALLNSFMETLRHMLLSPESRLSELSIISKSDILRIKEFNQKGDDFSKSESVVSVFERAADMNPSGLALAGADGELTYEELDKKANRIANALMKKGVGTEDIVLVRLPRTTNIIAAMLGVLKAGAAYLPLDLETPAERTAYIREDSHAVYDIHSGSIDELLAEENDGRPHVQITGDNLCYVIYTSGSTGVPKGVLVEHGNVLNYALPLKYNHQILTAVNECHASIAVGSLAFDIAVAEIYPFLLAGKPVVLADEQEVLNAEKLTAAIIRYHADFILCTPTRLLQYIENPAFAAALAGFKSVSAAGEAVTSVWLRRVRELTSAKLYNGYGPTETTAGCTFKELTSDTITIGPPISNVTAQVLDAAMRPVPILAPGELCISGRGVSRGYLNRPELTAKAFVNSEYSDGKMYRTGDIVYWTEDGDLQYIGRSDDQIKLRGLRIELSEIETVIASFGGIDSCAVLVKGGGSKAVLCAYIASTTVHDENKLREYLSERLTEYMVPSDFVFLDKMPMNANGKADRKALANIEPERVVVPCSNSVQRKLFDIIAGLLESDNFGITTDLYRLGLTSLTAMKLSWHMQESFGVEISSKAIMKNTTIEKLEKLIRETTSPHGLSEHTGRLYPLTKGQLGIYAEYDKNRNSVSYNMPMLYAFERGIDTERLKAVLESAIDAHPYVKSYVVKRDSDLYICKNELSKAEVGVFREKKSPEDLVRPFDLEKGPLYRLEIYETADEVLLFMDFHHIVFDGASQSVLLEDIKTLYEGGTVQPESRSAFDYSLAQYSGAEFEAAREHFRNAFAGVSEGSRLFADYQDKGAAFAAYLSERVPENILAKVKDISTGLGVTPASVYFSAFLITVSKYSMNNKIAVGTVDSGREFAAYRRALGMFVKTLPFFIEARSDETVESFIRRVHREMLTITENASYTYTDFSEDLGMILDTHFVYNEFTGAAFELGGKLAREIPIPLKDAKFALTLSVMGDMLLLDYRGDLYDQATCEKFLRSMIFCLGQFDKCQDTELGAFSLAAHSDIAAYQGLNDTDVYSPYTTMDKMFLDAVKKYDGRTAAVCGEHESLTYRELGEAAEKIAAGLSLMGVTENSVVAFCLPRGLGIVKAMFGIIRAGAAILPTDITWPKERIDYVVENSGAKLLITESVLEELESSDRSLAPKIHVTPDDLSYVIYTSGSTGKPKGAMLIQRNLTNFLKPLAHNCLVKEMYQKCHSILSISNVTFDISICEIFPAIFYGKKLAFADERAFDSPRVLSEFAKRHRVDCIQGTPSRISQYMEEAAFVECLKNVKVMLVAGENLSRALTEKLRAASDTVILNGYGPTETTLAASYQYVSERKITIGRPVSNAKMYVVDKWLNLQPQGCVGELCIGGCNVGAGYINGDELTREKFVRNPFGNGTLYHSGDLARLNDDGEIEFLGRMDNQIKLHGLRIELEEIESVMSGHPMVTACAVKMIGTGKDAYLCGYYTANGVLTADDLKAYLRKKLTYYMVPSVLIPLDAMPISTAGKIDRQKLPVFAVEETIVPCETKLQEEILAIVKEALGAEQIGISTDLFRLGLTSLLAVKLGVRFYNQFGIELSSMDILKNNTISLLEQLIKRRSSVTEAERAFERLSEYPLTENQMGVYIEAVKDVSDMKYNMPSVYRFDASVDPGRLADACRKAVRAHTYLNSYLKETDTEPLLVRNDGYEPEIDVIYAGEPDKISFVRPFELTEPPLYRITVYYNEEMTCLYADFHHILFDGESLNLFMRDVKSIYEGGAIEEERYTAFDYALLGKKAAEEDVKSYLAQFAGISAANSIRQDKNERGKPLGRIVHRLDETVLSEIQSYAAGMGVTASSVFLCAYQVVIARMTRKNEVVSAVIWDGRNDLRFSDSVGMFVRTLPMYVRLDGGELAASFVRRVQQSVYQNADNCGISYGEFCSKTGLLPELLYVYQNHADEAMTLGSSAVYGLESAIHGLMTAKFPITLNIVGPDVILEYDSGRYHESTMRLMLHAFETVTKYIVSLPQLKVSDISLADEHDLETIRQFNATETDFPHGETLVSLFEKQAAEKAGHIALIGTDRSLSYSQLDRRANRIANALIKKGVKTEDIVAVKLPRTTDIIAVFLGIMKAGAAYLPLDLSYPENRIAYCLEDSGAKLLVDESSIKALLSESDESAPKLPLTSGNLCYIIYTSGSTGKPKGVMAEHRGVLNYSLPLKYNYHAITIAESCQASLAIGSLAFDIAVAEIYPFLLSGKTVVLADENDSNDVVALTELIEKYHVDALLCTPSRLLKYIEHEPFAKALKGFRSISAAGEAVPISWLQKLKRLTGAKLYNGYGPTETTAGSVFLEMNDDYVNIGKPLANEKVFIVDESYKQLPVGMPGELCIAGYGVSRGYLNRAKLTAERFIEVPYAEGKMYCTGDLARWNERGELEYLGRTDSQIKYHGYRIELGEIEQVICDYKDITTSAVILRNIHSAQYMFAYFTAKRQIPIDELKAYMGTVLPGYMLPTAFMQMEEMPLNLNAKIDREALPDIDFMSQQRYTAPQNDRERALCEVFAKVLGLERVSADASFFELGGDSIKGIQVASGILEYGYRMQMRQLFLTPSAIEMAPMLVSAAASDEGEISGAAQLSAIQRYFFTLAFENKSHWNQSVLLAAKGRIDIPVLENAFEALCRHHDELRADFVEDKDGVGKVILKPGDRKFFEISEYTGGDASGEMQKLSQQLALDGCKLKAVVIRGETHDKLFITIHHLMSDAVSLRILREDLENLYTKGLKGERYLLPPKTTSYFRYAQAQKELAVSDKLWREREYWENADKEKVELLPVDHVITGDRIAGNQDKETYTFDRDATSKLMSAVAAGRRIQINDLMIAALMLALKERFGVSTVPVMLEGHGREDFQEGIDLSRTIGWFTSFYTLAFSALSNELETLLAVKERLRSVPENGFSYTVLRYLSDMSFDLRPEIQFNYLGDFSNGDDSGYFRFEETGDVCDQDQNSPVAVKLSVSGSMLHGQMTVTMEYDRLEFNRETIAGLMDAYAGMLVSLSEQLNGADNKLYTPSDFGCAGMEPADWSVICGAAGDLSRVEAIYHATDMQAGMLLLAEHYRERSYYHEQLMLVLPFKIDEKTFEQRLREAVSGHEALRSVFVVKNLRTPYQIVRKNASPDHETIDIRRYAKDWLPGEKLGKTLAAYLSWYLKADREKGFDCENEPMFRSRLFTAKDDAYILLLSFSHVILDKWSADNLLKELFDDTPIGRDHYGSYVKWLSAQNREKALRYWKELMGGAPDTIFPATGASTQIPDAQTASRQLDSGYSIMTEEVCKKHGVTASTFMQYAWGRTLMEVLRTEDVSFGYTYSGRPGELAQVDKMVGMFIRTLPIRLRQADTLKTLQEQNLDTEHFGYVSASEIQKAAALRHPAFRYFMTFQNTPNLTDDRGIYELFNHNRSMNDLNVFVNMDKRINIMFAYDRDKLGDEWVNSLADTFVRVIENMLKQER